MADTKISALPAVVAPVGTDEFACHQGGVTKKETKTQITAATDAALAADVANLAAHIAMTTTPIHGSSAVAAANTLAHRNATGDLAATDFNAVAGTAANPSYTFTVDPDTGLYRFAANGLGIATGGVHRAHWNTSGALVVNDAAVSSRMTGPGVTINQGAFDDEAVALQSTDVNQPFTTIADSDTYGTLQKVSGANAGLRVSGFKELATTVLDLVGYGNGNADTTKTVNGRAIVEARGFVDDGLGAVGNTNADGNVFGVRTQRGGAEVTLLLIDEDGDLHVLNDIVVAGLVDGVDVAAHVAAAVLDHPNDSVTDAKLRNSAATSVIGRAGAGVGDPADIVAGADNQVLARTGGTLAFQPVTAAMVTDRTRKFFVPATLNYNFSDTVFYYAGDGSGYELLDGKIFYLTGFCLVPTDFVSNFNIKAVIVPFANGNVYNSLWVRYGQCGEGQNIHDETLALQAEAVVQFQNSCVASHTLANAAAGDIVRIQYERDAVNVLDTIGAVVRGAGFLIEYTADS